MQGHGQCSSHVILDRARDRRLLVGSAHVDFARAKVFKIARSGLGNFYLRNQGKNDIGGVALLQVSFDAEGIRGVDEDTCVLGSNNGFDDGGKVVDIRQGLHTKDDIVEGVFAGGSFFRGANNWKRALVSLHGR